MGTALCALICMSGLAMGGSLPGAQVPAATSLTSTRVVAQPESEAVAIRVDPALAGYLSRTTLLDLGLRPSPTAADYQLAAVLFSIASEMDPQNPELPRAQVEAAWSAGDIDSMLEATRRVIRLDPKDTVAQLRLVSSVINNQQTLDGRLKLYERFLGPEGKSLDASVRSRLALDAALLEREQGNMNGFDDRLRQATTLDISNKPAASLAAQVYTEGSTDSMLIFNYQLRLLYADPLDPNVHLTMAQVLAGQGAYTSARRFLKNSIDLYTLDTGRAPASITEVRIALDWQVDGPEKMLKDLNDVLDGRRAEAQSRLDAYIEAQLPTDDLLKPTDILYDLGVDKLRLLASYNLGDEELTKSVLADINISVRKNAEVVREAMGRRGADSRALVTRLIGLYTDQQVMRAISGVELDLVRRDMNQFIQMVPQLKAYFETLEPMALFAEGRYDEMLEDVKNRPPSAVLELLSALVHEKQGRTEQASKMYRKLALTQGLNAYGAFAQSRLVNMGLGDQTITSVGRQLIKAEQSIPNWLDQMIHRPTTFIFLDAVSSDLRVEADDQPTIKVRMKNLAPIPLAVGPSQPLDARFLIAGDLGTQATGFQGQKRPKVVSMSNRLRLMPLEEMVVEVKADSPQTQWLLDNQCFATYQQRYRVLQGFRPRFSDAILGQISSDLDAANGGLINSPLGLTAETKLIQRVHLAEYGYAADELARQLASTDESARNRAVLACAARLTLPKQGTAFDEHEQATVINALMELYTNAQSDERARMILQLPHRHQVPAMIAFDDHVASLIVSDALINSRVDTEVFACALLTRTDDAESPIFDVLDQVHDERLTTIANIIRARLESSIPTIGTVGPGVDAMIPIKANFE